MHRPIPKLIPQPLPSFFWRSHRRRSTRRRDYTIMAIRFSLKDLVSSMGFLKYRPLVILMQCACASILKKWRQEGLGLKMSDMQFKKQTSIMPVGTLFGEKREFTIDVNGQLIPAALYDPIIIKNEMARSFGSAILAMPLIAFKMINLCSNYYEDDL